MVQSIESSNIISPQEMHQRVLMQKVTSYDKDAKTGLSKAELIKYAMDTNFDGGEIPEFAQKLIEKFDEVDQNKDGQISGAEMGSLTNYRGLWGVTPLNLSSGNLSGVVSAGQNSQGTLASLDTTDILSKNIQSLVKKGLDYVNSNPELMNKLEDVVHKII